MKHETLALWLSKNHPVILSEYEEYRKKKLAAYRKEWFKKTYTRKTPFN